MINQTKVAETQDKFLVKLDDDIAKTLPVSERKKLADAYLNMFAGFSWLNWTNKYSLGRAWQTALSQCATFIETKDNKNPAARYVKNLSDSHRKFWARIIMTHSASQNTIDQNDEKIKQFRIQAERMIQESIDIINLVMAQYNGRVKEQMVVNKTTAQAKTTTQLPAQPQSQQQSQQQQKLEAPQAQQLQNPVVAQSLDGRTLASVKPVIKTNVKPMPKPSAVKTTPVKQAPQKPIAKKPAVKMPIAKAPVTQRPNQNTDTRIGFMMAQRLVIKRSVELDQAKLKMLAQRRFQIWLAGQQNQKAA